MTLTLRRSAPVDEVTALELKGDALAAEALRFADADPPTAHALACAARRAYDDAAALRAAR